MQQLEAQINELKSQMEALKGRAPENKLAMVVFSGELDKVLAALVIATGAVAMGMEVVLFFTFWGTPVLRDKNKTVGGKDIMGNMFGAMLPKGAGRRQALPDEHGRHGHRHDEIPHEKEKRSLPGRNVRTGRGTRGAHRHLQDCPWISWGSSVKK